jgi:hypothetical protein
MRFMTLAVSAFCVLFLKAHAESAWVADSVAEHRIGCAQVAVDPSVAESVSAASSSLSAEFAAESIIPGAPEPSPESTAKAFRVCRQLGNQKLADGSKISEVVVPANPALLWLCSLSDVDRCQESLSGLLGDKGGDRVYAVPIYGWVDASGAPISSDGERTRVELELAAAGLAPPPREPKEGDQLSVQQILLVMPVPAEITVDELRAKLVSGVPDLPPK